MTKHEARFNVSTIDLHCHTTASDGKHTPRELLAKAQQRGIQTLAITDHDTAAGFREAQPLAAEYGINLVSGIELSCVWSGILIHIVGLNFDSQSVALQAAEEQQTQVRQQRAELIAQKLGKRLGKTIDLDRVLEIAQESQIGRPHFAQYLVETGLVESHAAAFTKFLGAGKIGDVKTGWPEMATVVRWIVAAGGIAVMAHAHRYKMTRTKIRACMTDFVEAGGGAIEVAYNIMDASQQQHMVELAKQFNLLGSCGSDYHGPNRFGLELGTMPTFPKDIVPVWEHF